VRLTFKWIGDLEGAAWAPTRASQTWSFALPWLTADSDCGVIVAAFPAAARAKFHILRNALP